MDRPVIVIVDYQMGNLGSIRNMFKKVGAQALISSRPEDVAAADRLVLPGVGAFDTGMRHLEDTGLVPLLREKVLAQGTPVLGICLGMQLMTQASEEGALPGLGWVKARTVRFPPDAGLRVPHMGWKTIAARKPCPLLEELGPEPRFYFVHSYHVVCERAEDVLTTTHYGHDFASAFALGNIFGVQFHPEKSHRFGMRLMHNFAQALGAAGPPEGP